MKNKLDIGDRRVGVVSVNGDGDHVPALVERTVDQIRLEIVFNREGGRSGLGDIESVTYLFSDVYGDVELIDCIPKIHRDTLGGERAQREYIVSHAIIDGDGKTWAGVTGLRSVYSGLDTWMHIENISQEFNGLDNGNKSTIQYELQGTTEIALPGYGELKIFSYPDWVHLRNRGIQLTSKTELYSWIESGFEISKAMHEHKKFRDLLSILVNDLVEADERLVARGNGGKIEGSRARWLNLIEGRPALANKEIRLHDFLISFRNVDIDGLATWIGLSETYGVGIDALVRSIDSQNSEDWENCLLNVAIAYEEIGYVIEESKPKEDRKSSLSFYGSVQNVVMEVDKIVMIRPEVWADSLRKVYRGVKHADRETPDIEDIAKVAIVGINILRIWVVEKIAGADKIEDHWWANLRLFYPWFWPPAESLDPNMNWCSKFVPEQVDE